MNKKGIAAILLTFMLVFGQIGVYAVSTPSVALNGVPIDFTDMLPPIIAGNEILVPIEFFSYLGFFDIVQFENERSGIVWYTDEIYRDYGERYILTISAMKIDYVELVAFEGISVMNVQYEAWVDYATFRSLFPYVDMPNDFPAYGVGLHGPGPANEEFVFGVQLHLDVVPRVVNGVMMLPLRPIAEAVGYRVSWSDAWAMQLVRKRYPEIVGSGVMKTLEELTEANRFLLEPNNHRLFWLEEGRRLGIN